MSTTTRIRTYSEMVELETFDERFEYLKLSGGVGASTFGFDRYINQEFYRSPEWERVRRHVILRDDGCDLGVEGYEIRVKPLIHHMNPMTAEDVIHREDWILDPEFLVLTCHRTHNNIHFGAKNPYPKVVADRSPRDTRLW